MKPKNIGDTVFFKGNERYHNSGLKTIIKIGRKFYHANGMRIDKETGFVYGDDFNYPGRCYESEAEYIQLLRRDILYRVLKNKMKYNNNEIPEEELYAAAKLLRLSLEGIVLPEVSTK